jgi:hypothetical protein
MIRHNPQQKEQDCGFPLNTEDTFSSTYIAQETVQQNCYHGRNHCLNTVCMVCTTPRVRRNINRRP